MRPLKATHLAIITAVAACGTPLPDRSVDSSYVWDGFVWSGGGGVYVSIKTFEDQGKVALCGVYSAADDSQDRFTDLGITAMNIKLGDEIIAYDIGFFKRVAFNENSAPVGNAKCRRTGSAWKPQYASLKPDAIVGKSRFVIYD